MAAVRHQGPVPPPVIQPGPRCGGPGACKVTGIDHNPPPGTRRIWTWHDKQCQKPNPDPVIDPDPSGPRQPTAAGYLDGYPVCSLIDQHAGPCDYKRIAAERRYNDPGETPGGAT